MQKYQGACECGHETKRYRERVRAERALSRHECEATPQQRCGSCRGLFWALVDDTLCIRCDALMFPASPVQTPIPVPLVIVPQAA